mgnify:CR=1 FL=1
MKVNWKVRFKFVKSLRFRILVILIIIGIVPSIIVEKGIVNSYEDRAVSNRQLNVKNQCDILVNQLAKENYLQDPSEGINSELTMLSNVYSGRILIVNQDFQVIKDTYDLDKGKYMISKEVVKCFQKLKESSYYDRKNSYIEMTMPIPGADGERAQGVLLISISTEEIVSSIDILEQKGLRILVISGVLVLIFGYILAGILIKPFAKITKAIEDITDGFQDEKISVPDYTETELITDAFNKMLGRVQSLDTSRQEFVSNVSHELKTPMTSIISYIDLLKKMDLDDEASSYVKILDKKAQKLKGIVSDVFSIAKATSGVDVNLTKLDFVMLLNQCIADAEDKIADSGKIVKININADSAMVMGDGDKLYRVFQNIVDNALNYSMDGTRIFLDVYKKADRIVFAEKNISAMPINFTEEEILERFVRGDKSRTDGGSGLGLSISKSFTEACGGIFNIEIDGDMFKAIVEMPIIQEDTAEKTDDKTE